MDGAQGGSSEPLTLDSDATSPRRRAPRSLWAVLAAVVLTVGALVVTSSSDDAQSRGLPVALAAAPTAEGGGSRAADSMLAWITYVAGPDLPALGGSAPAYRLVGSADAAAVRRLADALGVEGEPVGDGSSWSVTGSAGTLEVQPGAGAQWYFSSGSDGAGGAGTTSNQSSPGCEEISYDGHPCKGAVDLPCPEGEECSTPAAPGCAPQPDGREICEDPAPSGCKGDEPSPCPVEPPPPPPPVDLPNEDEARAIALDLLAATGLDTDGADVSVEEPYDVWYVTVEPRLGDVPSGLLHSVAVGSGGEIRSANGFVATPEPAGDHPVLDTRAAIDRANQDRAEGSPAILHGDTPRAVEPSAGSGPSPGTAGTGGGSSGDASPGMECDPADAAPDCVVSTVVCDDPTVGCFPPATGQPPDAEPPCATGPVEEEPLGAPESLDCPTPLPQPIPEPTPLEVELVDAERSLVLLAATDGSGDGYLVPAYRFTTADRGTVDLPAIADEALDGPPTTDTTVPGPGPGPEPEPDPDPQPQPCQTQVEQDGSGTTHTVQPPPECVPPDPQPLADGEQPVRGVAYYVDVEVLDRHCTWVSVEVGSRWWWAEMQPGSLADWSTPTEGGSFTLLDADTAEFVGDAERRKVALLTPFEGPGPRPVCA